MKATLMRYIFAAVLALWGFTLPANAEVVIPDCRKLETFPYRGKVTDRDWLDFFGRELIDISPQDFDKIRTAMLTCASQKEGRMFGRIDKEYFRRLWLDQFLGPIRTRAADLQIEARSKADTEELLAALESIGATLRPDVKPRPVLTDAQLAELRSIESKAADQDKTRTGKYLHQIRKAADSIRTANNRAIMANKRAEAEAEGAAAEARNAQLQYEANQRAEAAAEEARKARVQDDKRGELIPLYTIYLPAEICFEHGVGFSAAEFARIKAEVGRLVDALGVQQEVKNQVWGIAKNVFEAKRAEINEYDCGTHRQQFLFSMPHVLDDQSSTNPF